VYSATNWPTASWLPDLANSSALAPFDMRTNLSSVEAEGEMTLCLQHFYLTVFVCKSAALQASNKIYLTHILYNVLCYKRQIKI
jgi:hypothetical protein